jgi:hypothetical protein
LGVVVVAKPRGNDFLDAFPAPQRKKQQTSPKHLNMTLPLTFVLLQLSTYPRPTHSPTYSKAIEAVELLKRSNE